MWRGSLPAVRILDEGEGPVEREVYMTYYQRGSPSFSCVFLFLLRMVSRRRPTCRSKCLVDPKRGGTSSVSFHGETGPIVPLFLSEYCVTKPVELLDLLA